MANWITTDYLESEDGNLTGELKVYCDEKSIQTTSNTLKKVLVHGTQKEFVVNRETISTVTTSTGDVWNKTIKRI